MMISGWHDNHALFRSADCIANQNTPYLLKSWSSKQHTWKHWQLSFAGSRPVRAPEQEHVGSEAWGQRERLCVHKGKLLSIVRASEISETRVILTGRGLGWPWFGSLTLCMCAECSGGGDITHRLADTWRAHTPEGTDTPRGLHHQQHHPAHWADACSGHWHRPHQHRGWCTQW